MCSQENPSVIDGGLHVDTRGTLGFVNDFDFQGVERFYTIRAHQPLQPRGWRGHQIEKKWFTVVQGSLLLAVVKPNEWHAPGSDLAVQRFVLSGGKPQVLYVPPGHATCIVDLSGDAILLVFSSGQIADAKSDDYLFPVDTWNAQP